MPGPKLLLAAVLFLCFVFIFLGFLFIPYLGIQQDEALFAVALLVPEKKVSRFTLAPLGLVVHLMLLSYVGALKSWLYAALLHSFSPSVHLLRAPVLLLAAVTIYLFKSGPQCQDHSLGCIKLMLGGVLV